MFLVKDRKSDTLILVLCNDGSVPFGTHSLLITKLSHYPCTVKFIEHKPWRYEQKKGKTIITDSGLKGCIDCYLLPVLTIYQAHQFR